MNIKILVIEDEEAINDVIAMSLRATGYEVVSFLDGDEASASLETGHDYIYDVVIDREKRVVTKGGQEVYLKPMEFDCLMMLVRNKNRALTRSQLLGALWGMEFEGETRTVDAHISRIRKKLGFEDVIKTLPRIGYRLEVEE